MWQFRFTAAIDGSVTWERNAFQTLAAAFSSSSQPYPLPDQKVTSGSLSRQQPCARMKTLQRHLQLALTAIQFGGRGNKASFATNADFGPAWPAMQTGACRVQVHRAPATRSAGHTRVELPLQQPTHSSIHFAGQSGNPVKETQPLKIAAQLIHTLRAELLMRLSRRPDRSVQKSHHLSRRRHIAVRSKQADQLHRAKLVQPRCLNVTGLPR